MADDLAEKYSKLNLSNEEVSSISIEEGCSIRTSDNKLFLICKMVSARPFNMISVGRGMQRIWRLIQGMDFRKLSEDTVVFELTLQKDVDWILAGRPWSFEKQLLVISLCDGFRRPSEVPLQKSPFWIHVRDVPIRMLTKEIGEQVGKAMGGCMAVALPGKELRYGNSLKIRIEMDITKPLHRFVSLTSSVSNSKQRFLIQYERLPNFCYRCGILGHIEADCSVETDHSSDSIDRYGPWLRWGQNNVFPDWIIQLVGEAEVVGEVRARQSESGHPEEIIADSRLLPMVTEEMRIVSSASQEATSPLKQQQQVGSSSNLQEGRKNGKWKRVLRSDVKVKGKDNDRKRNRNCSEVTLEASTVTKAEDVKKAR